MMENDKAVEPSAGERRVFHVGDVDFAMRWIPAGRFLMGTGKKEQHYLDHERPQHEVTITRGFWMGETPVTQGQYQTIMGENPSHVIAAGLDAPVECVSWYDAAAFTNKLSALEGLSPCFVGSGEEIDGVGNKGSDYVGCKGWRLPTEAEWEHAARAGTTTQLYGDDDVAWSWDNSNEMTHAVGQKQANAWGLCDTLGNVWEWCYDWYGGYPNQAATALAAAAVGATRIVRGGSYRSFATYMRVSERYYAEPWLCDSYVGFRLVRSGL
jgi:formylglycine-generating enzyme required for sulfatase activity